MDLSDVRTIEIYDFLTDSIQRQMDLYKIRTTDMTLQEIRPIQV